MIIDFIANLAIRVMETKEFKHLGLKLVIALVSFGVPTLVIISGFSTLFLVGCDKGGASDPTTMPKEQKKGALNLYASTDSEIAFLAIKDQTVATNGSDGFGTSWGNITLNQNTSSAVINSQQPGSSTSAGTYKAVNFVIDTSNIKSGSPNDGLFPRYPDKAIGYVVTPDNIVAENTNSVAIRLNVFAPNGLKLSNFKASPYQNDIKMLFVNTMQNYSNRQDRGFLIKNPWALKFDAL